MKRLSIIAVMITLFAALVPAVDATQIIPSTLENMAEFSDTIVIGVVASTEGYWEDQRIFTRVMVDVQEYIKNLPGNTASRIELKVPGGTVGANRMDFDMAPEFEAGEKVMLFLGKVGDVYVTYAFNYGVNRITTDPVLNREVVSGPYFQYDRHMDAKTNTWTSNPDFLVLGEGAPDLDSFRMRIKNLIK